MNNFEEMMISGLIRDVWIMVGAFSFAGLIIFVGTVIQEIKESKREKRKKEFWVKYWKEYDHREQIRKNA